MRFSRTRVVISAVMDVSAEADSTLHCLIALLKSSPPPQSFETKPEYSSESQEHVHEVHAHIVLVPGCMYMYVFTIYLSLS